MVRRVSIIGAFVFLVALSIWLYFRKGNGDVIHVDVSSAKMDESQKEGGPDGEDTTSREAGDRAAVGGLTQEMLTEKLPLIQNVMSRFAQATTLQERAKCVRLSWVVRPYMDEYYSRKDAISLKPGLVEEATLIKSEGPILVNATVDFIGGERRSVIFEWDGCDFYLDWESLVNYSVISWEDFQEQRSVTPTTFRVVASEGEFYFPPYSDPNTWSCLVLKHSDSDLELYAYYKKNSLEAKAVSSLFAPVGEVFHPHQSMPLMVELNYSKEPSRSNQVLLHRTVARGWIRQVR